MNGPAPSVAARLKEVSSLQVDQVIEELQLALAECRGEICQPEQDERKLEQLRQVVDKIERALELLRIVDNRQGCAPTEPGS